MTSDAKPAWRFGPKILIPMAAATLAVVALAAFGLYWATNHSDAVSVERQIRTTQRAIDDSVARLALEQETVAVWDESVEQLSRRRLDMTWIDDNLGDWLHNIFGHDQTFILNERDQPVYANVEGTMVPAARFEAIRGDLRLHLDETRARSRSQ